MGVAVAVRTAACIAEVLVGGAGRVRRRGCARADGWAGRSGAALARNVVAGTDGAGAVLTACAVVDRAVLDRAVLDRAGVTDLPAECARATVDVLGAANVTGAYAAWLARRLAAGARCCPRLGARSAFAMPTAITAHPPTATTAVDAPKKRLHVM